MKKRARIVGLVLFIILVVGLVNDFVVVNNLAIYESSLEATRSWNKPLPQLKRRLSGPKVLVRHKSLHDQEGDEIYHPDVSLLKDSLSVFPYPGDLGAGVTLNQSALPPEEVKKFWAGWRRHRFNNYVSSLVPARRRLPDIRYPECQNETLPRNLPSASVVICFHNEAWSTLTRTLHSVLDRTPSDLLREVILVDDNSSYAHLGSTLDDYVSALPKVKVLRLPQRQGLIRARLQGFKVTRAPVVVFLDSHCECFPGWLEPMLARLVKDPKVAATPVINTISQETFSVDRGQASHIGVFDLPNLAFVWRLLPQREITRRKKRTQPIWSPAMAGGIFAIRRELFDKLGQYDPQLNVWGAENIELSLKVWLCGGRVEIVPCSHVGHVFRSSQPYTLQSARFHRRNARRVADVWLDDFRRYVSDYTGNDLGDVTERRRLRESLQCQDFAWYVRNVFPELFYPGSGIFMGEIRSQAKSDQCLDASRGSENRAAIAFLCHGLKGTQHWELSETGEIRNGGQCLAVGGHGELCIQRCRHDLRHQVWEIKEGQLRSRWNERCVCLATSSTLGLCDCRDGTATRWNWQKVREPFLKT